jgi:sugar phosphate isomerase/epimerase
MGEAKVFKMMIDHYYDKDEPASIKRLAADRGTSLSVVQGFYNVNAEDDPISKAMNMGSDSE